MAEVGPVYVDSKTITSAGTPEALTTRDIRCDAIFILPKVGNTGSMEITDSVTTTQQLIIPASGITLPISNPALISLDATVSSDGVDWVAV